MFAEVHIVKHMEEKVCSESQNVTFQVEVSHPSIDPVWTFRNQQLKPGPKHKMVSKGMAHSLTVSDAMKDEEGLYMFHAGQKTSSAKLTVSGMSRVTPLPNITSSTFVSPHAKCEQVSLLPHTNRFLSQPYSDKKAVSAEENGRTTSSAYRK